MPIQIPTYFSKTAPRVIDRGGTSPASTGLPVAEGLHKLVVEWANIHVAFTAEAAKIERAQAMATINTDARRQTMEMEAALAQDPDWSTYEKRWGAGFSKIKAGTLSSIKDPTLKAAATLHFGDLESDGIVRAAGHTKKMAVDSFEEFRLNSQRSALDAVSTAQSPEDEAASISNHLGVIAAQEKGGWLAPNKAAKERLDFIQDVKVSQGKRDILLDPDLYWEKKKVGVYTGVDLPKMDHLDAAAIRQAEHNNRIAEHQVKKVQEKNDALYLAGVDAGTIGDSQLDDVFLGPTRDPNFISIISPGAYKEGKLKIAARSREGGPRNSGITDTYKMELAINPDRYSDKEITRLGDKGLNPSDVLDILEYKRARISDLQKMPPGAVTGLELIRQAVPRGFLNTMNDKVRAKLIENEQEYISRVRKAPEKWESIANEISNRWKTVKNPHGQSLEDFKKELNQ
jgi:hypothetical protein